MKKPRHKSQGRVVLIQACDWCGSAFAKQMTDGVYCNVICMTEHRKEKRLPPGTLTGSVEQLVNDAEDYPPE